MITEDRMSIEGCVERSALENPSEHFCKKPHDAHRANDRRPKSESSGGEDAPVQQEERQFDTNDGEGVRDHSAFQDLLTSLID